MGSLVENIGKLHTTDTGAERLKRNLRLETDDVVQLCRERILDKNASIPSFDKACIPLSSEGREEREKLVYYNRLLQGLP